MNKSFVADTRELKEIQHCLFYAENLAHGTVGHNLLMLGAKAFGALGFSLDSHHQLLFQGRWIDISIPIEVTITHQEVQ